MNTLNYSSGTSYERLLREHEILLKVSQGILSTLDLEKILQIISDGMSELLEIETAAVYLIENDLSLFLGATTPALDPGMPEELRRAKLDDHLNIKKAVTNQLPHVLEDAKNADLTAAERLVVELRQLRTILYLPLIRETRVVGVLILGTSNKARQFSNYEIELTMTMAHQLSLGIQNAQLHLELVENTVNLEKQIQENRKTEKALLESEAKLSNALRIAKLGHWEYDIVTDQFTFNDEFYELYRTTADKEGGYKMSSKEYARRFVYPDDQYMVGQEIKKALEAKEPEYSQQIQHRIVYGNGSVGYIVVRIRLVKDTDGKTINAIGANQDITENIKIEQEVLEANKKVEESELLYRSLFKQAAEGICMMTNEGKLVEVNQSFVEMHGYTLEEMMQKDIFDLDVRKEKTFESRPNIIERLQKGEIVEMEVEHFHKNGHIFSLGVITQLISIKEESFLLCFHKDLTERKKYEQKLLKALEKAEESDRLKSAFLQNMSHEIRTPMNGIVGFAEMLKNPGISDDKRNYFIDIIGKSSQQLLSIVNDIITISSLETNQEVLNESAIDLNYLVSDIYNLFSTEAESKNLRFEIDNDDAIPGLNIITDAGKLRQVLTNLISNALKFTQKGSVIFGYKQLEDNLEFFVRDSGIGVRKGLYKKIFERFHQADIGIARNYGGTGLGLSISKGLVELMGGRIGVESELNRGSLFYFTIPLKISEERKQRKSHIKEIKKTSRVLVVEDEEINFLLIEELFEGKGIQIIRANCGEEAVNICKEKKGIDLVLMDIKMPGMDGYTATKIIKEQNPDMKIIALTAYALEKEISYYQGIFNGYVTKPVDQDLLFAQMNKFLNKD